MALFFIIRCRPGWEHVEAAYQKALAEIHEGDPADAITDAATALQEALKFRGCSGNTLGKLADDARRRAVLSPHDAPMAGAMEGIIDWVESDRSEKGDAHNAKPATREDAWLTVHVVGALILRLTGEPRTDDWA